MAFVRNPIVYVPDLTNGRPVVDGKVYLLAKGTIAPTHSSSINPATLLAISYINEAGNTVPQPQPLYTSKGGCLYGSYPDEARQFSLAEQEYVFAVYNRIGRLEYAGHYTNSALSADYVGETAPLTPFQGMRWYNPTIPTTFIYYVDVNSEQWVEEVRSTGDAEMPKAEAFGIISDGVTVNNLSAVKSFCTSTGKRVWLSGVTIVSPTTVGTSEKLILGGLTDTTEIKLAAGSNTHVFDMSGNAVFDLYNLTVNQVAASQSGGHCIRSGGAKEFRLKKVKVTDCKGYGVGFQGGTTQLIEIDDLIVDGTNLDGFDLKDYNYNNGVCRIGKITVRNANRDAVSTGSGIDIRGEFNIDQAIIDASVGVGFRLRDNDGTQGRAAFGVINNLIVRGPVMAMQIQSSSEAFTINNVLNIGGGLLLHSSTARGGLINNAICKDGNQGELMSIFGRDLVVNNLQLKNTASSGRLIDLEPGCDNIQFNSFGLDDVDANAEAVRAQTGATNISFSNGWIRGGDIGGSAGASVIRSNVRII